MLDSVVAWLSSSSLNNAIQSSAWTWPILESFHFVGLILMLGALLIIDLALIGVVKGISPKASHRLLVIVICAFIVNLVTGILFIFGDPGRYFINIGFQLKMLFMLLAGLNALWYTFKVQPNIIGSIDFTPTGATRIAGSLSLIFWFLVLILGRLIPYVGTG